MAYMTTINLVKYFSSNAAEVVAQTIVAIGFIGDRPCMLCLRYWACRGLVSCN